MLKYIYSKPSNKAQLTNLFEQKAINDTYTNKFFIRSSILETKDTLILDNNSNFFLIQRKSIEKHLNLFKEKHLLGKSLQLKNFVYYKKNYFKLTFFIKNQFSNNISSYLKTIFLLQKNVANRLNSNWTFLIVNKGGFFYFFNGLKGFLAKKNFNKFKKIFKVTSSLSQRFQILLKKHKKVILKSLLLKNLKNNKAFLFKNKYKNQINRNYNFSIKPNRNIVKTLK